MHLLKTFTTLVTMGIRLHHYLTIKVIELLFQLQYIVCIIKRVNTFEHYFTCRRTDANFFLIITLCSFNKYKGSIGERTSGRLLNMVCHRHARLVRSEQMRRKLHTFLLL